MSDAIGVDSLLRMVSAHEADELRLGTDEAPRILKRGAAVRLSVPATTDEVLRLLLGPLLSDEREAMLRGGERVELIHTTSKGERYAVAMKRKDGGSGSPIEVVFRRSASPVARAAPVAAPAPIAEPARPGPERAAPVAPHEDTKIPRSLRDLLARAAAARASDVHLYAGEPPSLRIDGDLRPLDDEGPIAIDGLLGALLDEAAQQALSQGRSVDRPLELPDVGRFRLNLYRAGGRLAAALRVLPPRTPSLAELRMPVPLEELIAAPHGLIVVCGPTGSGKSATLAALAECALALAARRGRSRLLITLEDPVEYAIRAPEGGLVRQRQIGSDAHDFPTGLRDALREDPDILLIGEMRDPESIGLAMTAAETGHLVLTSLHSRSAASSIERIVDSYPAGRQQQIRVQLADALRAVVAQRLLPSARGKGRVPAVEILRGSLNVASLIREGKTAQLPSAIQSGKKDGMIALERCLADLVHAGQIEREQALSAANDPTALSAYLGG